MYSLILVCWFNSTMSYETIVGNADGYNLINTSKEVYVVAEANISGERILFCE